MRADDLSRVDLIHFDPAGAGITVAGQRALLLDSTSMGLLHQHLVEGLGVTLARSVGAQVGFWYGGWLAEALEREFAWESQDEWVRAGTRVCMHCGLFDLDMTATDARSDRGCTLHRSFEAELHLQLFGRADAPVCWAICGVLSGYLSHALGEPIIVTEDRCVARGDATCHVIARDRTGWPELEASEHLHSTDGRLDVSLERARSQLRSSLKVVERPLRQRSARIARLAPGGGDPGRTVALSAAMTGLLAVAHRVAAGTDPILLTGECGVGKQRVARLVHELSGREDGPFVVGRCGGVSELLLESELFGHVQGAFADASEDRVGLFEAAHRGTLLLDEIAEAPPRIQAKVLRLLETGVVRRMGEPRDRRVDVRLVAATSRNLAMRAPRGIHRPEFLRRLHKAELHVPALRERREDILPLARVLLAEAAASAQRPFPSFSPAVIDCLTQYPWPGNVREMGEAMHRAVAVCSGDRMEVRDLPSELRPRARLTTPSVKAVRRLDDVEREHILAALDRNMGNQTRTAQQLQIGTATLYRKLRRYGRLSGGPVGPHGPHTLE